MLVTFNENLKAFFISFPNLSFGMILTHLQSVTQLEQSPAIYPGQKQAEIQLPMLMDSIEQRRILV